MHQPPKDLSRSLLHLLPPRRSEVSGGCFGFSTNSRDYGDGIPPYDSTAGPDDVRPKWRQGMANAAEREQSDRRVERQQPKQRSLLSILEESDSEPKHNARQKSGRQFNELGNVAQKRGRCCPLDMDLEDPRDSAGKPVKRATSSWGRWEGNDLIEPAHSIAGSGPPTTRPNRVEVLLDDGTLGRGSVFTRSSTGSTASGRGGGRRSLADILATDDADDRFRATNTAERPEVTAGRAKGSAAIRRLAGNPTAERVIAYLTRSFNEWKLSRSLSHAPKRNDETYPITGATCSSAMPQGSGTVRVHLGFLVSKVECAFSLYMLRGRIVWADEKVKREIESDNFRSCFTGLRSDEQGDFLEQQQRGIATNIEWTIVLTTDAFRPNVVSSGKNIYLSRPFFVYPAAHVIVSSLNITTDAAQMPNGQHTKRHRSRSGDGFGESCSDKNRNHTDHAKGAATTDTITPDRRHTVSHAFSTDPSPSWVYDPLVREVKNRTPTGSSHGMICGREQGRTTVMRLGPHIGLHPCGEGADSTTKPSHSAASDALHTDVENDPVGAGFPRGPGEEWEVPLELLLSLRCQIADNILSPSPKTSQGWGGEAILAEGHSSDSQFLTPPRSQLRLSSSLSSLLTPDGC